MNRLTFQYNTSPFGSGTWVDFSNYLIGSTPIPIIQRNNDYSLTTKGIDFSVSENIGSDFEGAEQIRVKDGVTVLFIGKVISNTFDKSIFTKLGFRNPHNIAKGLGSHSYKVKCDDILTILRDNKIRQHSVFQTQLEAHPDWEHPSGYLGTITLSGLFEVMFTIAYLSTTTVTFSSGALNSIVSYSKTVYDDETSSTQDVKIKDLRVSPLTLWNINQDYAQYYSNLYDNDIKNYDVNDKIISYFDYISFVCSALSLRLRINSTGTGWDVVHDNNGGYVDQEDYGPLDDEIFRSTSKIVRQKYENCYIAGGESFHLQTDGYGWEDWHRFYSDSNQTESPLENWEITPSGTTVEEHKIKWLNHFILLIQNTTAGADGEYWDSNHYMRFNILYPVNDANNNTVPFYVGCRLIIDAESERAEKTIEMPRETRTKNVLRNSVAVKSQLSIIKSVE